jgi:TetR/AcrR family transcriptional repressor of uid operon
LVAKPKPDRADPNARKALIEAAVDEFSRKGYAAATLADIARRAGVTTGAVYAHFEGKLDLMLEALGLRTANRFLDVAAAAAQAPAGELTETLAKGLLDATMGRRAAILLDVIAFARRDAEAAEALAKMVETRQRAFERTTRAGVDSGLIDPALPDDELARLMIALAFGMIVQRTLGEATPSAATVAQLARLLLHPAPDEARGQHARLARVRARAASAARAQRALHTAIVEAARDGHSLRTLGQAAGVSHERIRAMLGEHDPAA